MGKKRRSKGTANTGRKPASFRIRKRQKMCPWMWDKLDCGQVPGFKWFNKEERMFGIRWVHRSNKNYDNSDSEIFRMYFEYTAKHRQGTVESTRWKTNFRCALNAQEFVEEVKDLRRKGADGMRVFRFNRSFQEETGNKVEKCISASSSSENEAVKGDLGEDSLSMREQEVQPMSPTSSEVIVLLEQDGFNRGDADEIQATENGREEEMRYQDGEEDDQECPLYSRDLDLSLDDRIYESDDDGVASSSEMEDEVNVQGRHTLFTWDWMDESKDWTAYSLSDAAEGREARLPLLRDRDPMLSSTSDFVL